MKPRGWLGGRMSTMPAVFRRRRPTPFERLARERPRIVDTSPDWKNGLLMALAAVLLLGWLDANDRATFAREQALRAGETSTQWMERAQAVETTAAVRLVEGAEGFHCQVFNIQREWELAVAAECKKLASLLRTGRATP